MFEELLYPTFVAISPDEVLKRHDAIIGKYGMGVFLKRREFQRAREMYQTARYAIGMTAKTDNIYWVTPARKEDQTPDTYILWADNVSKKINIECVEVTLWEEHQDDLFTIISKKIKKSYPYYFVILVHAERPREYIESKYFADIIKRLKTYKITAGAVRFWMPIEKGEKDTLIGELYPLDNYTTFRTSYFIKKYDRLSQKIIKVDVISGRVFFKPSQKDVEMVLPDLPELTDY